MKYDIEEFAKQVGGTIEETGILPDGSDFAVMSFPLSQDHWIYGDPSVEKEGFEPPPMPMRMGTDDPRRQEIAQWLTKAGRYAIRASTMKGTEVDFDPDALIQNLIIGMLGYQTPNGLSNDEWANPSTGGES